MPELPEVETLRRELGHTLPGRTIVGVDVRLPKMFMASDGRGADALVGLSVVALRRRAKFLIVDLSGDATLVFHLRLAGQLVHRDERGVTLAQGGHPVPAWGAPLPHKSTHVIFRLHDRSTLYLTDIRQFGRVWFMPPSQAAGAVREPPLPEMADLGPEPLEPSFTVEVLAERLAARPRAQLKPLLLDQSFIGGVGNIYADEIAFAAGLGPGTRAGEIDRAGLERLHGAIRSVLEFAVQDGVAQILNGIAAPGRAFPKVHGRAGQPCPNCRTPIVKTRFAGRGTYTCPACQAPSREAQGESHAGSMAPGSRLATRDT